MTGSSWAAHRHKCLGPLLAREVRHAASDGAAHGAGASDRNELRRQVAASAVVAGVDAPGHLGEVIPGAHLAGVYANKSKILTEFWMV